MSIKRRFDVSLIAEMALREKQVQQNYRQCCKDLVAGIKFHGHSGEHPLPWWRYATHRPHKIGRIVPGERIGAGEYLVYESGILTIGLQMDLHPFDLFEHAALFKSSPRSFAFRPTRPERHCRFRNHGSPDCVKNRSCPVEDCPAVPPNRMNWVLQPPPSAM